MSNALFSMEKIRENKKTIVAIASVTFVALFAASLMFGITGAAEPNSVYGYVTYEDGTPVDGATVNITVINTTDSSVRGYLETTTASDGYYSVQMGNLDEWEIGDEIVGYAVLDGHGGTNTTTAEDPYGDPTQRFDINITDPKTTKTITGPQCRGGLYVTSATVFNLTAETAPNETDPDGIDEIRYRIWYDGSWTPEMIYGGNFSLTQGQGTYYIEYYSIDLDGDEEPVHNQTHIVDDTPPENQGLEFASPNSTIDGFMAVNCETPIWLNVSDNVQVVAIQIWRNKVSPGPYNFIRNATIYDNGLYDYDNTTGVISVNVNDFITEGCYHEVRYAFRDCLGNGEIWDDPRDPISYYDVDFAVDCAKPVIEKYVGEPKHDGIYGPTTWVSNHTVIWLNATDRGCGGGTGVARLGYTIGWKENCTDNSEAWNITRYEPVIIEDNDWPNDTDNTTGVIRTNLTFEYGCCHEIAFWAEDYVGNQNDTKQKHWVDNVPPAIYKHIPKIVADDPQTQWNNERPLDCPRFQRFAAPWSYMDAVSVYLCGNFTEPINVYVYDMDPVQHAGGPDTQLNPTAMGTIYPDDIPTNETGYYCGWVQIHLDERLYTEHDGTYYLEVYGDSSEVYWKAHDDDPYAMGNGTMDCWMYNDTWDFTFKIEYFPYHPYSYPLRQSCYSVDKEPVGVSNVAIFKDGDPWGNTSRSGYLTYDPTEQILNNYGIPYTVYDSSDIGGVDLSMYDKVIISSDQNQSFYDAVEANLDWFEAYADSGGQLEIHAAANAWWQGNWTMMPGGFTKSDTTSDTVDIAMPDHPILEAPHIISDSELDNWHWSHHGYFLNDLPSMSEVILTQGTGEPVFVMSPWGNGSIMITTQPVEWGMYRGYSSFLENLVTYCPLTELHNTWITSEATLELDSWEEGCMGGVGFESLHYRIWFDGTWHPTDMEDEYCTNDNIEEIDGTYWYIAKKGETEFTEIQFHEECKHVIQMRSEDLFGNVRIVNQTHYVDDSPPEVRLEYPDQHGFYYDDVTGKQYARAGKTFYLNLTDMPEGECASGVNLDTYTFYWRLEYQNASTPAVEKHPNATDDYLYGGTVVEGKNEELWYMIETGDPSVALTFMEECQHTFYYYYEASDWLDNHIVSDVESDTVYIDDNWPTMEKEHPPCYYDEDWIYLHPGERGELPNPWQTPVAGEYWWSLIQTAWMELHPENGRPYFGTDLNGGGYFTEDGFIENGDGIIGYCDYMELYDEKYGVHRLYHVENLTVTLELYNETMNETMYVDFMSYWDGYWPEGSDFGMIQSMPEGTLWRKVYPDHNGSIYNLTYYQSSNGFSSATITLNDTATGIWHNWTVENASWDLILDPVPFIQACGRINLTASDAEILKTTDQYQSTGDLGDSIQEYNSVTTPWPWDSQTFTPTADAINETHLWLRWTGNQNVTLYIHDGSSPMQPSNALISKTVQLTGSSLGEWVPFVFEPGLDVTPGNTYYIEIHREAPIEHMVHWEHSEAGPYAGGFATVSGEEAPDADWKFATLSYLPNPCSSGIEDIYYAYEFEGVMHPINETDNASVYGEIVNITKYYDDAEIRANFSGRELWYTYDPEVGVHFHEECIHWLYYWAKDNVCHHTDVHRQVYHVDADNPRVYKEHPDHGYSTPVEIDVDEYHDNASGLYDGYFRVDASWTDWDSGGWMQQQGGNYVDKYTWANFTIKNNDLNRELMLTLHVQEVTGDDGITLTNGEDVNYKEYVITVPPGETVYKNIFVYDNIEFLREGEWHWWVDIANVTQYLRAGAKIDLWAEDPGYCASGVENIYYRYEWNDTMYPEMGDIAAVNGSTLSSVPEIANYMWYIYNDSEDIVFTEECKHDLYYFAKDRSCHNSTLHHQVYYVDDSEPVVEEELPDHGAIGNTTQSLFEHFDIDFGEDWTILDGNDTYWGIKTDEPYAHHYYNEHDIARGRYAAFAWSDGMGDPCAWMITPRVTVPEDGNVTFWYRTYYDGSDCEANFELGVSTVSDPTNTGAFDIVWESGQFDDQYYRKAEVDISQYAGQQVYIGFHPTYLECDYPTGGLLVDDVWVGAIERVADLFNDDMENMTWSMEHWTIDDLTVDGSFWQRVRRIPVYLRDPPAPSMNCYDGSLGNGPSGFGQYSYNWDDTLALKEPINLSDANCSDNVLMDFSYWMNLELGQDLLWVEASNDSENWTQVGPIYSGSTGSWSHPTLNLSDYKGNETVWIRFRFKTDDGGGLGDAGVFLDNVSIYNSTYDFLNESNYTTSPTIDTFDDPWANWTAEMLETSMWHIVNTTTAPYNNTWWNGNDSAGEYLNYVDDALISPEISLTGHSYEEIMLTFWHKRTLEDCCDDAAVEVRFYDGGWSSWTHVTTFNGDRDWVKEYVALPHTGTPSMVQFRFRFTTDYSVVDLGWYIDNVHVELRNYGDGQFMDDFERDFPPEGWEENGFDTTNPFYSWTQYGDPWNTVALVHGYSGIGSQVANLWTPTIEDLPKFSNLTVRHKFDRTSATATVYVHNDSGSYHVGQFLTGTSGWVTTDIPLWQFYGQDIQIRFSFVTPSESGNYYDDFWAIEWVNVTSLGFLRQDADIHLSAYDQPVDSECDAGVSAIYWRYAYGEEEDLGEGDYKVCGSSIPGISCTDTEIYDYEWWKIQDNGDYDDDLRQGYISVNVSFEEECIHDIYYFAKDILCHSSELHHERFYVDGTPPNTYMGVSWGNHPWIPKNGEESTYQLVDRTSPAPDVNTTVTTEGGDVIWDIYITDQNYTHTEFQLIISETSWGTPEFHVGWLGGSTLGIKYYDGGWGSGESLPGDITITGAPGDEHFQVIMPDSYLNDGHYFWSLNVGARNSGPTKFAKYPSDWNGWSGNQGYAPAPEWYEPGDSRLPNVICIYDDFHFWAEHWGDEPCIYPYNHQDRTYYRWEVWNYTSEEWEEAWPTGIEDDAIWGNDIDVSDHEEDIEGHWWANSQGPDYFDQGCLHRLIYFSKDDLCNTEEPNIWEVGVDDEPPVTNITFDGPEDHWFQKTENLYYMQNDTQICLEAEDMPNHTECQTGVWYINYTVWHWVTNTYDIKLNSKEILSWAPVYDADTNNNLGEYDTIVDSDNSNDLTPGDYLEIDWTSTGRDDGWYLIKDITKVGSKYLLNVQDATENASGYWESLIPWTRVYDTSVCLDMELFEECGKYEIHYYAVDYNNMSEEMHVPDIMVDCTPPISTKTFGQPVLQTEIEGGETVHIVNATTPICFSAVDPRLWDSGVRDIRYRFEPKSEEGFEGVWQPEFWDWHVFENVSEGEKRCFTLQEVFGQDFLDAWIAEHGLTPDPAGLGSDEPFILYHHAIDNVSHEEPWLPTKQKIYYNPYLDETPPNISKGYEQPNIQSQILPDLHYITSETEIWLHGTDEQGGLVEMQVAIISTEGTDPYPDEEDWWTAWSGTATDEVNITFTIADYESEMEPLEEGTTYYLFFRAIDHAGLMSDEGKQRFRLDDTPPTQTIEELDEEYTYGDDIVINVTAMDNWDVVNVSSVTLLYRYRHNETDEWSSWTVYGDAMTEEPYTWHFDAPMGPGYYEFATQATDGLGNAETGTATEAYTYVAPVAGDFDGDGEVDITDLMKIVQYWQYQEGDEGWEEASQYDISGPEGVPDGKIDIYDLNALASNWTG